MKTLAKYILSMMLMIFFVGIICLFLGLIWFVYYIGYAVGTGDYIPIIVVIAFAAGTHSLKVMLFDKGFLKILFRRR